MAWTETTPGVFKKDFNGVEKIYRKMSTAFDHIGREHWGIHCVCGFRPGPKFREVDVAIELREAWKALMMEFPGLSVISDGLTKVFRVPDAHTANEWADRTFFVEPAGSADAIIANARPRDLPSLYYLPSSSEICFLSQHWRNDAFGTCMLLDRLFSILMLEPQDVPSSSRRGAGPENLSPSLEDAAGSPENGTSELQGFAREYIDKLHEKAVNAGGLPYKGDAETVPSGTSHQDVILTSNSTAALVTACKSRSVSVSAAIHTALAHTVFSFAPPDDGMNEYTTVMAVNLRAYLQPPYDNATHACQTYVASIAPSVLRSSDFAQSTATLTRAYKCWHSKKFMQSLRCIYQYHAVKLFAPSLASGGGVVAPPKPSSGVTLSSLGVIEQHLTGKYGNAAHVDRFRFGVSMMTRQMLLYAWTFRGQLSLSLNYNAAYYDSSMAQEVLSRIKNILAKELGLTL